MLREDCMVLEVDMEVFGLLAIAEVERMATGRRESVESLSLVLSLVLSLALLPCEEERGGPDCCESEGLSPLGFRLDEGRGTEEVEGGGAEVLVATDCERWRMEVSEVFRLRSEEPPWLLDDR